MRHGFERRQIKSQDVTDTLKGVGNVINLTKKLKKRYFRLENSVFLFKIKENKIALNCTIFQKSIRLRGRKYLI